MRGNLQEQHETAAPGARATSGQLAGSLVRLVLNDSTEEGVMTRAMRIATVALIAVAAGVASSMDGLRAESARDRPVLGTVGAAELVAGVLPSPAMRPTACPGTGRSMAAAAGGHYMTTPARAQGAGLASSGKMRHLMTSMDDAMRRSGAMMSTGMQATDCLR